jgi:replicative DNA helicase
VIATQPPDTGVAAPHSIAAEESVIGAILLAPNVFPKLRLEEGLAAEHFFRDKHRAIFEAMCELHGRGDGIDVLTVTAELERRGTLNVVGGKATVDALTGGVPGLGGVRSYARIVSEHWVARERLSSYEQQAVIFNHGSEEEYQAALRRAHAVVAAGVSDGFLGRDALANHILRWLEEPEVPGLPLPVEVPSLSRLVRLRAGHTLVLAAWPSGGKSLFASRLATTMGAKGHRTIIWSNEDTAEEVTAKYIQTVAGIPADVVTEKRVTSAQMPKIVAALADIPFEIQPCHDWSAAQIATHMRQESPAVAVVDHFHNLSGIGTTPDVDESIRVLAAAAGQTGCLLILCAQLNSARLTGVCKPPPVARDLRGSGMFLAAAHTMILVHRDEEELDDGERGKLGQAVQLDTGSINVAKNKVTGKTGVLSVMFDADRLRFIEPARQASDADAWLR